MRYRIRHTSRYGYGMPVDLAAHMVHLRPRPRPFQTIVSAELVLNRAPARRRDEVDYFGNAVIGLFLDQPHADIEVTAGSVVDVEFPSPPAGRDAAVGPGAEAARQPEAWRETEFRFGTAMAPVEAATGGYGQLSFPPGRPVLTGPTDLTTRMFRELRFRAGVTTISTPVSQVMQRREGVCQDFTHVMISALRGLGLPARYVSGYIRTRPPPGQPRRQGVDQPHAWVSAWIGPEHRWVDLDPTNGVVVKDEHVLLGWGRDYSDVRPVRGVVLGGGADHWLSVSLDLAPEPVG